MQIVVGTGSLAAMGGTETYVLTLAPELQRLGHRVTVLTDRLGDASDEIRRRGIDVMDSESELPRQADATYAQDTPMAFRLAGLYPEATRWMAIHSSEFDLQLPPPIPGIVSTVVAMNDVTARRAAAVGNSVPIVRLRQPVDAIRSGGPLRATTPHVLFFGNYFRGPGFESMAQACDDAELPWNHVGLHGTQMADPWSAIAAADIIVAMGRAALEAMACGRAVWVAGPAAADGWVDERSYVLLEADGFRGHAGLLPADASSFAVGLKEYEPEMGLATRGLVRRLHSRYDHAAAVANGILADTTALLPHGELEAHAAMVRTSHYHQARALGLAADLEKAVEECRREADAHEAAERRLAQVQSKLSDVESKLSRTQRRLSRVVGSRRWRVANAVLRPLDRSRISRR